MEKELEGEGWVAEGVCVGVGAAWPGRSCSSSHRKSQMTIHCWVLAAPTLSQRGQLSLCVGWRWGASDRDLG